MKLNLKALQLVEKGLKPKTVQKLTESQINILYSRLVSEQLKEVPANTTTYEVGDKGAEIAGVKITKDPATNKVMVTAKKGSMEEQSDTEVSSLDKSAGGTTQDPTQVMAPDGMGDLSDKTIDKEKEVSETENNKKSNPWAICTAQLGKEFGTRERHLWSAKEKNKYERCVKDVKKSLKEGKNPVSLFIENEIMKIVERNLPPRITKGDLLKYLTENNPATAPSKPKEAPPSKPGKPDTRPKPRHPAKKPENVPNPSPKAAKEKVIDIIMDLLDK